ncbi:Protein GVQW1, partial [Plecturocebus cupreus]
MGFHYVGQYGLDLMTSRSTHLSLPNCWDYRRMGSHYVAKADLELLGSSDLLTLTSQSHGIYLARTAADQVDPPKVDFFWKMEPSQLRK